MQSPCVIVTRALFLLVADENLPVLLAVCAAQFYNAHFELLQGNYY